VFDVKKIALGSAQWGLSYGVANSSGITHLRVVRKILRREENAGIELIDTAPAYGVAQTVLGLCDKSSYKVVTKIPSFGGDVPKNVVSNLLPLLERTLKDMCLDRVYGLLVHDERDLLSSNGRLLRDALFDLKAKGLVERIGVSIYEPSIAGKIAEMFVPDVIQLPLNVFDQRAINTPVLEGLKKAGVEIHARSIFLQGLLLISEDRLPKEFSHWRNKIGLWQRCCRERGVSPLSAALDFTLNQKVVDYGVIGTDLEAQLHEIIDAQDQVVDLPFDEFSCLDKGLIDPRAWKIS